MKKLAIYMLKRGLYYSLKYNVKPTIQDHYDEAKIRVSYIISLSFIFFPIMGIIMLSLKLLRIYKTISNSVAIIAAITSIFLVLNPVQKFLDSIPISEIQENSIGVQKRLGNNYIWMVLSILIFTGTYFYLIRVIYLCFK